MTPQEKAEDLIIKFSNPFAKSCALIAIDEVISVIDPETNFKSYIFWKEVKQEIEKL